MNYRTIWITTCLAATLSFAAAASAQLIVKQPLDHSVYDSWRSIRGTALSNDGKWIVYVYAPQEGDMLGEVQRTSGDAKHTVQLGASLTYPAGNPVTPNVRFTDDSKFLIAIVAPKLEVVRKQRKDKTKPEDQAKNALYILNLETGKATVIDRVASYQLPDEGRSLILYRPEPPKPEPAKPAEKKEEAPAAPAAPAGGAPAAGKKDEPKKKSDHRPGDSYVLRDLATEKETKLENVVQARFNKEGSLLVYAVSTKDGKGDGIEVLDTATGATTSVVRALGRYPRFALDEKGTQVVYLTDKDDYEAKRPSHSLYVSSLSKPAPKLLAKEGTPGIPKGWWIPGTSNIRFSPKGSRVLVGTQPKPEEEPKDERLDDEKVNVDIWNWKDPVLQPQQLLQAASERNRTYDAIIHLPSGKIAQLETPTLRSVTVADRGDGSVGLASDNLPYQWQASWDMGHSDYYLVDVGTGAATKILSDFEGSASLSPTGRWVYAYDEANREAFSINTDTKSRMSLSKEIPYPIWDELNDVPSHPSAYGAAGWTAGDARILVYDSFDIWSIDPSGKAKPVNVTDGYGRNNSIRLRYVRTSTDPDEIHIPADRKMLLAAFHDLTKASGFYWESLSPSQRPERILMDDKMFGTPQKAKNADVVWYTRQDFVEYPDLWLAEGFDLKNPRKITRANPQQDGYIWGRAELVQWTSLDGVPLQGILIKPENFDYGKKYPMITYFYERSSDTLHAYRTPAPSASTINLSMYPSNGYLIFIPDIPYKVGYPGESAVSAIVPGVQSIVAKGYVDPKRLGIQGQSWGGYQVTYLITETTMFAAAEAGAPVSNMFSAYGGIRWGSGLVRQFQYEQGQSRIEASIWEKPLRYLENSPVFFADKVQTPLMIMHNDKDGAVPWYQGIEMFTALRRLNKPVWLVVYNDEDHNLVQRKNRKDLSVRLQQFFDHYLKGSPMPKWMSEGIPAVNKGRDYGLEVPGQKKGG